MLPIHRISNNNSNSSNCSSTCSTTTSSTFDAFIEQSSTSREADQMRWLSRPNLSLVRERHSSNLADLERFRISFDVTGFRQENIKISIENHVLTVSGVHEEGSRESGSYSQKQFEKRYELPSNVDLDSMASYVNTQQNQLIVEIPLIQSQQQTTKLSQQQRLSFAINKPDQQWEQRQQKSTKTTTSSTQDSTSKSVTIDIPSELLKSGKTLTIEKHSEIVIDGHRQSHSPHPTGQAHDLCLVDTQQQDQRSVTATHQLSNTTKDGELVQIKIEVSPETLQNGKTITIQKSSTIGSTTTGSNQQQQPSGNFVDLYKGQQSTGSVVTNNVHIEIPEQLIEKGQTILVQKDNVSVTKTSDYHKQQAHSLTTNQFSKSDHLQSKNMMEVTIQVAPELLNSGQAITIRREDLKSGATDYHHDHTSKTNQCQVTNGDNSRSGRMMSMQEFMSNKTWNPSMSSDCRLLQMRLEFNCQPTIVRGDQLKMTLNGHDFRVETTDQQGCSAYRQVTLPTTAQLAELKCQFDEQRRCLNISVPLH